MNEKVKNHIRVTVEKHLEGFNYKETMTIGFKFDVHKLVEKLLMDEKEVKHANITRKQKALS